MLLKQDNYHLVVSLVRIAVVLLLMEANVGLTSCQQIKRESKRLVGSALSVLPNAPYQTELDYPSDLGFGEIQFYPNPDISSLTAQERGMVASYDNVYSAPKIIWANEVADLIIACDINDSEIPDVLTKEFLMKRHPLKNNVMEYVPANNLINPLTGKSLRIRERDFSAGNMYIKVLDSSEMAKLEANSSFLEKEWDVGTHEKLSLSGKKGSARLSRVAYVRVYGKSSIIMSTLIWWWWYDEKKQ